MRHETGMFTYQGRPTHVARWYPEGSPRAAVALAHGLAEHVGRYRRVGEALVAAGYLVVATDHPGHGRSDGTTGLIPDLGEAADALVAALDATPEADGVAQVALGHSLGSAVAALAVLGDRARWRALVLSGTVLAARDNLPGWQVPLLSALARVAPSLRAVPPLDAEGISSVPAVVQAYRDDPLVDQGRPRLGTALALLEAIDEITTRVAELTLPVLLVHGVDDEMTPISGAEWLAENAPSAELRRYPGLHEVFNEAIADQAISETIAWLDAHTA